MGKALIDATNLHPYVEVGMQTFRGANKAFRHSGMHIDQIILWQLQSVKKG